MENKTNQMLRLCLHTTLVLYLCLRILRYGYILFLLFLPQVHLSSKNGSLEFDSMYLVCFINRIFNFLFTNPLGNIRSVLYVSSITSRKFSHCVVSFPRTWMFYYCIRLVFVPLNIRMGSIWFLTIRKVK